MCRPHPPQPETAAPEGWYLVLGGAIGRRRPTRLPATISRVPVQGVEQLKQRVCEAVDRRAQELIAAADWIHAHPEIGHQEVQAAQRLTDLLKQAGIASEMGTAGMATAFKAELGGQNQRPRVAILAEYDAL